MKPDERERMYQLCAMIENEKDHRRFLLLIQQLNELLERTERKFKEKNETGPDLTSAGQK